MCPATIRSGWCGSAASASRSSGASGISASNSWIPVRIGGWCIASTAGEPAFKLGVDPRQPLGAEPAAVPVGLVGVTYTTVTGPHSARYWM